MMTSGKLKMRAIKILGTLPDTFNSGEWVIYTGSSAGKAAGEEKSKETAPLGRIKDSSRQEHYSLSTMKMVKKERREEEF